MATLFDVERVTYPGGVSVTIAATRHVEPADGVAFTFDELYVLLRCYTVEIVPCGASILAIDEEAKLTKPPRPRNYEATSRTQLLPGDWIAGPALLCRSDEVK